MSIKETMGGGEGLSADIAIVGQDFKPGRVSLAAVKQGLEDHGAEYVCLKLEAGYQVVARDNQQGFVTEPFKTEKAALAAALDHFERSKSVVT